MKKSRKRIIWIALIVIITVLALFIFKRPKPVIIPQIYTVKKSNLELFYTGDGTVVSEKVMAVYSTTSGKVKSVYHRLWDNVKKGDILIDIDKSSIDDLNNSIKIAKLRVDNLSQKLELNKQLYENGLLSKNALNDTKNQLEISKLEYDKLLNEKSKVELLVKAPISGVITELDADDNYSINLSKPLFKIADTDNLKIVLSLPNDKVKNLKDGDLALISSTSLRNNQILEGKIVSIGKISDIDKQYRDSVTNINIKLKDNSILKPGDLVDVKIVYKQIDNKIIIPSNFLESDREGNPYVLVLNKDNKLEKRDVEVGDNDGIYYVITKGLEVNDKIINNSYHYFKAGDVINDNSKQSK